MSKTKETDLDLERERLREARDLKRVDVALEVLRASRDLDVFDPEGEEWKQGRRRGIGAGLVNKAERVIEGFLGGDE